MMKPAVVGAELNGKCQLAPAKALGKGKVAVESGSRLSGRRSGRWKQWVFSQGDGGSRGGYSRHLRAWCCGRSLYKAEGLMIRVQIRDSNVVPGGLHVLREGSPTNPTRSRSREQKLIYYKGGVWHHWHCS
jgi:hypothetical protein